jgi:hypothetical protein
MGVNLISADVAFNLILTVVACNHNRSGLQTKQFSAQVRLQLTLEYGSS